MGLNESKGNMYEWVTHTWNAIKGRCPHDCSYCYMKRWNNLKPVRLDGKELKTDLGNGNFIFVGSSCDMWAEAIPTEWIIKTLEHFNKFDNHYLFQSKNPARFNKYQLPKNSVICTTIETNRWYPKIMNNSPYPIDRSKEMTGLSIETYLTIEPIIDFDIMQLVELIKQCKPKQVNIGADSGNNNLPEPGPGKLLDLINELESFTTVKKKKNLKRLL
ncbi:hypothetical protein KA005_06680 [bacterium]|nr:hypothetical protein [bacterium]